MKKIPPLLSNAISKDIIIKKGRPIVNTIKEDIMSNKRFTLLQNNYPNTSSTDSATALIIVSTCSLVKLYQTGNVISLW